MPSEAQELAVRMATLEQTQIHREENIQRFWNQTWPKMEESVSNITSVVQAIREEQIEAKNRREQAASERKQFRETLNEFKQTLNGLATKDDIQNLNAKMNRVKEDLEEDLESTTESIKTNCETLKAIKKKQDEHDKLVTVWKTKGKVFGFGIIALGTLSFELIKEGAKKWFGWE